MPEVWFYRKLPESGIISFLHNVQESYVQPFFVLFVYDVTGF